MDIITKNWLHHYQSLNFKIILHDVLEFRKDYEDIEKVSHITENGYVTGE